MKKRSQIILISGVVLIILGTFFLGKTASGIAGEKLIRIAEITDIPDVYLGVTLHKPNDDLAAYFKTEAGKGLLVLEVEEDSPTHRQTLPVESRTPW